MATPSAFSPAPHEAPTLHDSIEIGKTLFPSDPREGAVSIKVKTGVDVEQQKANGKNHARTKIKGKKVGQVTLTFTFTRRIYATANALRLMIDPNCAIEPGSWEVRHPELSDRRIDALVFKDMGALERTGDRYSFTVEAEGWIEPKAAAVGGTKTPKVAKPTPTAASLAKQFDAFAVTLGAASQRAVAANNAVGISSAAEAIRRAAAGMDPNPPFDGPEV